MSGIAGVLTQHQYRYGDRCCSCEDIWYDTRRTHAQDMEEHALHVEKELLDAGFGRALEDHAQAWDRGYRDCNEEWQQTFDIVTPDEDRFVARNPYGSGR